MPSPKATSFADDLASVTSAPRLSPRMSAALPGTALPADLPVVHAFGPDTEARLNEPLVKLTGVDAIDAMTSPVNLALMAFMGAKPAAQIAGKTLAGVLASVEPAVAAEIVGVFSPRLANALKVAARVAAAAKRGASMTASPTPTSVVANVSRRLPPEMAASMLREINAGESAAVAAPVETAAVSPAARGPITAQDLPASWQSFTTPVEPGPAFPVSDTPRVAAAATPVTVTPAAPIVAASGKMQLTAPEMQQFARLLQRGVSLPDALTAVKAMRDLATRLGGATAAEVKATIAARNYKQ